MKFLVIQTAFIGDVVLATPLVEKLHQFFPDARIDFMLRKGNEKLLDGHPHLHKVWIWDKRQAKYQNLWKLTRQFRRERYDWIINCQRFAAAGLVTVAGGARHTVGFNKNPLSLFFSRAVPHVFGTPEQPVHETMRNLSLIRHLTDEKPVNPRLYPQAADAARVEELAAGKTPYVCIAPTSVWFTKQYPLHKWKELMEHFPDHVTVFLLGGPGDAPACDQLLADTQHPSVHNLAGQLSFLESAALMKGAAMNYVNDSAPLHLASSMDAPVAAVFCSTLPLFGFTPLSSKHELVETREYLPCRPCGLHGRKACPKGHFACAESIAWSQFPIPD